LTFPLVLSREVLPVRAGLQEEAVVRVGEFFSHAVSAFEGDTRWGREIITPSSNFLFVILLGFYN
jgi:hypothetical protein